MAGWHHSPDLSLQNLTSAARGPLAALPHLPVLRLEEEPAAPGSKQQEQQRIGDEARECWAVGCPGSAHIPTCRREAYVRQWMFPGTRDGGAWVRDMGWEGVRDREEGEESPSAQPAAPWEPPLSARCDIRSPMSLKAPRRPALASAFVRS